MPERKVPSAETASIQPDSYLTVAGPARAEVKIQRSRFLGLACPVASATAARTIIAEEAKRYHDARHVCHAWRIGLPPMVQENRNDDGEPSGTAGEPILLATRQLDLTQVLVVVVRYFGGVKLGTGGLSRAYGEAATTALAATTIATVKQGRHFSVRFPYAWQKSLQHLVTRHAGEIRHEDYGAEVSWLIWLPHSCCHAFAVELTDTTAGAIDLVEAPDPQEVDHDPGQ